LLAEDNAAMAAAAQAEADTQRLSAQQQAALAFARELASNAVLNLEQDSQLSLLLALQAVSVTQQAGIDPVPWEVQQALHDVVFQSRLIYAIPDLGEFYAWSVLFSPDGKWIAVDETLSKGIGSVKDITTGERVITITGFLTRSDDAYHGYSFSPDGNWLAWSGNGRGEAPRLWDLTAWRKAGAQPGLMLALTEANRILEGCNSIFAPVAFSPDGKRLAIEFGPEHNTVKVWDLATGQGLWESPEQPDLVSSFDFSPDGSQVVSCDNSGNVLVWDAAAGEQLLSLKGFYGNVSRVTYSPDGKWIAAAGEQGVLVWNVGDGSRLINMSINAISLAFSFSPDGKRLAVTRGGTLEMWDVSLPAGGELTMMPTPQFGVDYEVSDDRKLWVVSRWDGWVEFIRSDTFETIAQWQVYTPTEEEKEIYFVPMLNRDNTL
jgi:WD40 repeat protein